MFSFQFDVIFFFFFSVVELKEKIDEWKRQKQNKKWKNWKQTFDIEEKAEKKRYEQFFYLLYYYYNNPHQEKEPTSPIFRQTRPHPQYI